MAKSKKANKSGSSFFWIVIVVAVVLLALIVFLSKQSSDEPKQDETFSFDYSNQPFEGDENAPVEIVEFGDYKCPACKDFNDTVYPVIQKDLIETGKAKLYFMNYPFIYKDSERSAQFAETVYQELGNDVFWKFHHLLYSKQPKEEKTDFFTLKVLKDSLAELVNEADVKKVEEAFKNKEYKNALAKDRSYVSELKIDSTPSLFINGKKFTGSSYDEFIQEVKDAAKK
ncbi:hypothetical protein BLX88_21545 [Bacillus obstructivus]|nr:hypothetical protein BLX88_21545 [Bacillus obstructivus]